MLLSSFRKNWLKILLIFFVITTVVLSVMLYNASRLFYYEQNLHTYAVWINYIEVERFYHSLSLRISFDKNGIPTVINDSSYDVYEAIRNLEHLDPPHERIWLNIEYAHSGLRCLNSLCFFPNGTIGPEFTPDKVYPYILALNEFLTKADKGAAFTSGEYLYNQGANRFEVDEHANNGGRKRKRPIQSHQIICRKLPNLKGRRTDLYVHRHNITNLL